MRFKIKWDPCGRLEHMYVILFLVLVILVAILMVYLLFSRTPTLTPKKIIVETISAADQDLFQYRQDLRSLISDILILYNYNEYDDLALNTRSKTADYKRQDVENKIFSARNNLAPYQKIKSSKQFYELAEAALAALEQVIGRMASMQGELFRLKLIISNLHRINALTSHSLMYKHLYAEDNSEADLVLEHIMGTISELDELTNQLDSTVFETDEFRSVVRSLLSVVSRAGEDYRQLASLLGDHNYSDYMDRMLSLPGFFARFDSSSYNSIISSVFDYNPQEALLTDLWSYAYE